MPKLIAAAFAVMTLAATAVAGVGYWSVGTAPSVTYAEATAVTALAARVQTAEQLQRAQSGSIGGLTADVQKLQRALEALTAPPAKGKGKDTVTGSVKLK